MSHKLPKITGFKKVMHMSTCLGAAVVILGALFKIMHWPGSGPMLIVGLGTEAVLFALFASDIPHEDYDWSKQILSDYRLATTCEVIFSPVQDQQDPTELANKILHDRLPVRFQIQLHKLLWDDARGK